MKTLRKLRALGVAGALALLVGAGAALGEWPSDPTQNLPVCTATGGQYQPSLLGDGAGGTLVVWQDTRGGSSDLYGQRIDSSGTVRWTADGLAVCSATGAQTHPAVVSDGAGGAIVAWQDSRSGNYDLYAQRIDSSGTVRWRPDGVLLCGATEDQRSPSLVGDGAGGAIVVWEDGRNGGKDVFGQRLDSSGTVRWTPDGVAVCSATGDQSNLALIGDGSGGAIVAWQDYRNGNADLYAQRINEDGTAGWLVADGTPISTGSGNQQDPALAPDGSGGAVIAWTDSNYPDGGIFAQRIDSSGTVQWSPSGVAVTSGEGFVYAPTLLGDDAGGAYVGWADTRTGTNDVYLQRLNSLGQPQFTPDGVLIAGGDGQQESPVLSGDGSGGALVGWSDFDPQTYDMNLYGQRVDSGGNILWSPNGIPVATAPGSQYCPTMISDGSGGALLAWEDYRTEGQTGADIYAQRVRSDGTLSGGSPPEKSLSVSKQSLSVPEGGSDTFTVKLDHEPLLDANVMISNVGGDPDLLPSPSSLTFTPGNWDAPQTVTVSAAEDDDAYDGTGTLRVSSEGLPSVDVSVTESDNDTPGLSVAPQSLSVDEGGSDTFTVSLKHEPLLDANVMISNVGGDPDLLPSPSSLTFTPGNWDAPQTVTVSATEDDDAYDGTGTLRVSSDGVDPVDVSVTESDNDTPGLSVAPLSLSVPEGGNHTFTVSLKHEPLLDANVMISNVGGDPDLLPSPSSLTFTPGTWDAPQTVTVSAAEDDDAYDGTGTLRVSSDGVDPVDVSATESDNDTPGFSVSKQSLSIPEGEDDTFTVKLQHEPLLDANVMISNVGGDPDLLPSPSSLTFTPGNWDAPQTVTVSVAEDDDVTNGSATVRISSEGIPSLDVSVTESDSGKWQELGTNSASGNGISDTSGDSSNPRVALGPDGNPVVTWQDHDGSNSQIYLRRWDGSAWVEVGAGSATGGGISDNATNSENPSVAVGSDGNPVVAWQDSDGSNNQIYLRRWDGSSWVEVGSGSATGGGLSNNATPSGDPAIALGSDGKPIVSWYDGAGDERQIYLRRWDGSSWVEVGAGSASGGGISNNSTHSTNPSIALGPDGNPLVAWQDYDGSDHEIYMRRWDGARWVDVGKSGAQGGGVSNNAGNSYTPGIAAGTDPKSVIVWANSQGRPGATQIYVQEWRGPIEGTPPWYPRLLGAAIAKTRASYYGWFSVEIWDGEPTGRSQTVLATKVPANEQNMLVINPADYFAAGVEGLAPGTYYWRYRGYDRGTGAAGDWQSATLLTVAYPNALVQEGSLAVNEGTSRADSGRRVLSFNVVGASGYDLKITGAGWSLRVPPGTNFSYPVYPFNPYAIDNAAPPGYAVATVRAVFEEAGIRDFELEID